MENYLNASPSSEYFKAAIIDFFRKINTLRHSFFVHSLSDAVESKWLINRCKKWRTIKMSNASENSRIEVLRNNQLWMSWIGIYSHSPTNQNLKAFRTYVAYYMLFHMTTGISFSAIFVHDNPSDFQGVLEALLVIVAASQGYGCYVTVGSKLKEVKSLHFKIQGIVDKSTQTLKPKEK